MRVAQARYVGAEWHSFNPVKSVDWSCLRPASSSVIQPWGSFHGKT
jgi:hypothetical protein